MKIRPGFSLHRVVDIHVVVGVGSDAYMPNQIMSVNDTGASLWHLLEKGAEKEDLVQSLVGEYGVDEQTASRDVDTFLALLRDKGLIDD